MILRRTIRTVACLTFVTLAACRIATAAPPPRPDEVQVIEPAGKEAQ